VLKLQGLSLRSLGSNGSSAMAVELLQLHQGRLRGWQWQMEVAGRWGPARHPEAVSAAVSAAVEWRLMIEAKTCRMHWQKGVGNDKLENLERNKIRLVRN
jgi:hypothetical protein